MQKIMKLSYFTSRDVHPHDSVTHRCQFPRLFVNDICFGKRFTAMQDS